MEVSIDIESLKNEDFSSEEKEAISEAIVHELFLVKKENDRGDVLLYGSSTDNIFLPEKAIAKKIFISKNIIAKSEDGKEFHKTLSIFKEKGRDSEIISFGGYAEYELSLFEDFVLQNKKIDDLCIDAQGRNHGSGPVWVNGEDISEAIKTYIQVKRKNIDPTIRITEKAKGTIRVPTTMIFSYNIVKDKYLSEESETINPDEAIAQGYINIDGTVFISDDCAIAFQTNNGKFIKLDDKSSFDIIGDIEKIDKVESKKIESTIKDYKEDIAEIKNSFRI